MGDSLKKGNELKRHVSVIIPIYNAGDKLKNCICSILRQSFSDFTLILVDDGSTDKSGEICDEFAERDNRVYVIHQINKGSVEARKIGIFYEAAQKSEYLMLCDADDTIPKNALKILVESAKKYEADCVCGNMRRMVGNVLIPKCLVKFIPQCFQTGKVQAYSHDAIMKDLYISCFGISNYPVTLWGKLYKRELLTSAAKMEPIVRFMGEDLSMTLRIMPNIDKLIIIPDVVYYYRIGGETSKFMPYMLDDFLALYHYKDQFRQQYEMDSSVKTLMEIELLNITCSYLQMCKYPGKFSKSEMNQEILKVISIPEIEAAAISLQRKKEEHIWVPWILNKNVEAIEDSINQWYKRTGFKRIIMFIFNGIS